MDEPDTHRKRIVRIPRRTMLALGGAWLATLGGHHSKPEASVLTPECHQLPSLGDPAYERFEQAVDKAVRQLKVEIDSQKTNPLVVGGLNLHFSASRPGAMGECYYTVKKDMTQQCIPLPAVVEAHEAYMDLFKQRMSLPEERRSEWKTIPIADELINFSTSRYHRLYPEDGYLTYPEGGYELARETIKTLFNSREPATLNRDIKIPLTDNIKIPFTKTTFCPSIHVPLTIHIEPPPLSKVGQIGTVAPASPSR